MAVPAPIRRNSNRSSPYDGRVIRNWAGNTFVAFSYGPYRQLWGGMVIASFAYSMMQIAQAVVAYDLTGRNEAVGAVTFAGGIATLLVAPVGGVLSDHVSRRMLLTVGQGMMGVFLAATGVLLVLDQLHIVVLALFAAAIGGFFGVIVPARQSAVRELVPLAAVANGIALQQIAFTSARVVGPFVVGFLLALSFVGAGGAYLIMALMLLLVVVLMSRLPEATRTRGPRIDFVGDFAAGLRHVLRTPRLAVQFSTQLGFVIFGITYQVLIPGFLDNALGREESGVAVLFGAAALGGLLSSFVVAGFAGGRHVVRGIAAGLFLTAAAIIWLSAAQRFWEAGAAILLIGFGSGAFQALNQAYLLRESDPRYLGKVASISMMAFGLGQMAGYPIGFLADAVGERVTFAVLGGALMLVAATASAAQAAIGRRPPARPEDVVLATAGPTDD